MKVEIKSSELLVLVAASVMSFIANLPDSYLGDIIDKQALLGALVALVVVAMFRYLQVMLLLTISVLAIGANLPEGLASALGVSQTALIISLGALIAITLLNRVFKLLPTDRKSSSADTDDGRHEMLVAIAKGDHATVHRLLVMRVDANFTLNGTTPLHLAAEKGYPEIVRVLIGHGADFRKKNAEGKTPLEVAQAKRKFVRTEEILSNAGIPYTPPENRRADADIWHTQYKYNNY